MGSLQYHQSPSDIGRARPDSPDHAEAADKAEAHSSVWDDPVSDEGAVAPEPSETISLSIREEFAFSMSAILLSVPEAAPVLSVSAMLLSVPEEFAFSVLAILLSVPEVVSVLSVPALLLSDCVTEESAPAGSPEVRPDSVSLCISESETPESSDGSTIPDACSADISETPVAAELVPGFVASGLVVGLIAEPSAGVPACDSELSCEAGELLPGTYCSVSSIWVTGVPGVIGLT